VAAVQAARDLDVAASVLWRWVKDVVADTWHAFPSHGQLRPEQQEEFIAA
jgi:transposase